MSRIIDIRIRTTLEKITMKKSLMVTDDKNFSIAALDTRSDSFIVQRISQI